MSDDLRIAARGIGWNYLGSGAILAAQVLYTALTARLVSPAGFGSYAAAQALIALVGYFGLATIGNALIRNERQGRDVVGTAFTISIAAGAFTSVAVFFIAGPWSRLWGVPGSESVGELFSIILLLSSLSFVPIALIRSSLQYRRAALIEALSQVAGMGVGATVAIYLHNPYALVIGQVAGAGLIAAWSLIASRHELALGFSRAEAGSLLTFSGQVSGQSLVYYGLYTAPSLVISRLFGAVLLGGYSRANLIVTLPVTHLVFGVTKTLYPLIARARADVARLQRLIESTVVATTGLIWPLFAALAGASSLIVQVLLGPRWSDVAPLLPPIFLFGAVNLAYAVAGNPLEVLGYQRIIWRIQVLWVCLLAAALALGVEGGLSAAELLWLVAGVQIVVHGVKLRAAARLGLVRLQHILSQYGASALVSIPFFLVGAGVERATSGWGALVGVAAEILTFVALASLIATLFSFTPFARLVRDGLAAVRNRLRADGAAEPLVEPGQVAGEG